MERIEGLKWLGTAFILSGILMTNLNIYPLNIFLHGAGVVFWSIAGYITQDKPVLANFGFILFTVMNKDSIIYLK